MGTYHVTQEPRAPDHEEWGSPYTVVIIYDPKIHGDTKKVLTTVDIHATAIERVIVNYVLEDIMTYDYPTPVDNIVGLKLYCTDIPVYDMECGQVSLLIRSDPSVSVAVDVHYRELL